MQEGLIRKTIKQGYYRHFKGNIYRVLGEATHSETLAPMIIYERIVYGGVWGRPQVMWEEIVRRNGYVGL